MKGGAVSIKIQVLDPPARRYNVFIGASIQAKTSENYKEQWKTKQEYDEKGKDRIAREMTQSLWGCVLYFLIAIVFGFFTLNIQICPILIHSYVHSLIIIIRNNKVVYLLTNK